MGQEAWSYCIPGQGSGSRVRSSDRVLEASSGEAVGRGFGVRVGVLGQQGCPAVICHRSFGGVLSLSHDVIGAVLARLLVSRAENVTSPGGVLW